jgi:uncharacterized protein with ParB-like and HNH nuclease domain
MGINRLELKSINQLFEYSFYIPSYQRGYRWTDTQVTQLLDDIWDFAKNPPIQERGKEKPFYCLQPIVVRKNGEKKVEVIDGQQRLTTLFLILKKLQNLIETSRKNFTEISYETRIDSKNFLENVENKREEDAEANVDYYHIWQAYKTIQKWFQDKADNSGDATPSASIAPAFLNDAKVIWYEINETENNNPIDIFTRLNIGQIHLTNAELIKALFLQKGNFAEKKATLKQIQIASEWDIIEKTLQDDAFWFFIYNPENPLKYDNRIEYIFDLMKGRTKESEDYYTFNEFFKDFSSSKKSNNPIDDIWLEIKKFFLTFDEWFKDPESFHYIGYLIACEKDINVIKNEISNKTKEEFKDYLKTEIKEQVKCKIDDLEYGNEQVKRILLLFNIQTILKTQKSDMRFPFHKYKLENWDIEHICSQTDKTINSQKRLAWIDDILEYFTGTNDIQEAEEFISENDEDKAICDSLIKLKKSEKIDEEEFKTAFESVQKHFKENSQTGEKDDISNLALLDATTNRSYGNSFFPIKRKRIIENDKNGIFVPIATKNLFLKYYSRKMIEIMYWTSNDAKDYLTAIKTTLKDFLP